MKIKGYKLFLESNQNEESIRKICKEYGIKNWSINSEGLVDVNSSVNLSNNELTKLPLKFGKVSGHFLCSENKLITLEGSPKEVGLGFYCSRNQLVNLEGAPREVGGSFYCSENKLTTLEGSPKKVGGFSCSNNQLTNLIGGPQIVINTYYASNNYLRSFEGFPEYYEGHIHFDKNPVQEILDQFPKKLWIKAIYLINDYDAIWDGQVVEERLDMVKEKLGLI